MTLKIGDIQVTIHLEGESSNMLKQVQNIKKNFYIREAHLKVSVPDGYPPKLGMYLLNIIEDGKVKPAIKDCKNFERRFEPEQTQKVIETILELGKITEEFINKRIAHVNELAAQAFGEEASQWLAKPSKKYTFKNKLEQVESDWGYEELEKELKIIIAQKE